MQCFAEDIDLVMAQIGVSRIEDITGQVLFTPGAQAAHHAATHQAVPASAAT